MTTYLAMEASQTSYSPAMYSPLIYRNRYRKNAVPTRSHYHAHHLNRNAEPVAIMLIVTFNLRRCWRIHSTICQPTLQCRPTEKLLIAARLTIVCSETRGFRPPLVACCRESVYQPEYLYHCTPVLFDKVSDVNARVELSAFSLGIVGLSFSYSAHFTFPVPAARIPSKK